MILLTLYPSTSFTVPRFDQLVTYTFRRHLVSAMARFFGKIECSTVYSTCLLQTRFSGPGARSLLEGRFSFSFLVQIFFCIRMMWSVGARNWGTQLGHETDKHDCVVHSVYVPRSVPSQSQTLQKYLTNGVQACSRCSS